MITSLKAGIGLDEIVAIHEPILAAIRAQDPDAAAAAMRRHFDVLRSTARGGVPMSRLVDLSMPVHPGMLTFPRVPPPTCACTRAGRSSPSGSARPSTARPG